MYFSNKFSQLPRYLFAEIDEMKREALKEKKDIIDLSIGDPDQPTFPHIIEALYEATKKPVNHKYPTYNGMQKFRETVALWFNQRFKVKLCPETEILTLIGAKEGLFHSPFAFINPGDMVLIPNPGYPVYYGATIFAGGIPHFMPLLRENNFLPDIENISKNILKKTKILFINYPNNPTTGVASYDFLKFLVEFCHRNKIIILHDTPYSEITFDDYISPSLLQLEGAKEITLEFYSFSKTYNMAGFRLGFVVGNKDLIRNLTRLKENTDSGVFQAIQYAGIEALTSSQKCVLKLKKIYEERRNTLLNGLKELNWEFIIPQATLYNWLPIPFQYSSLEFTKLLLEKVAIVTTPGIGFGEYGEGYIRIALTVNKERIKQAIERIKKIEWKR